MILSHQGAEKLRIIIFAASRLGGIDYLLNVEKNSTHNIRRMGDS